MFLSLSTWLYDHLPVSEVMTHVDSCGYKHVELSGRSWADKWKWRDVIDESSKRGITIISAHCSHHEHPELYNSDIDFEKYHQNFYKEISGIPGLIIVEHISMEKRFLARSLKQLEILLNISSKHNYIITIENLPEAPKEQMNVLGTALSNSDRIFFTFDAAHAAYVSLNPIDFLRFSSFLVNVHAYDVNKDTPLGDWLPCGLGNMNWPKIIDKLKSIHYKGPITVELNERNLRQVLNIISKTLKLNREAKLSMLSIEDVFAIYSRRYLEELMAKESDL